MTDKVLVFTSAGNEAEAKKIATELVERRLAACVNIIPRIHSVYRWQGKVEASEEHLLVIKSTQFRVSELQAALRDTHSYELPECIVISIQDGSADYLKWVEESVRSD